MVSKLTEGYVDYSQGRHLFVTKVVSAEAQNADAAKSVTQGRNELLYVHYHPHLAKCVRECKKYSMDDGDLRQDPVFVFPNEDNEVAQESS